MRSKFKEGQIIIVHWIDQSSYTGPVQEGDDCIQEAYGRDVGFYLKENRDWLTIAAERFQTDIVAYRHIFTFPKKCITKIEVIR
ncbi:MAG: hypothetical protein BWY21_00338 [Parcubacteria group bacterium ADurb.Bin216]|nr:MAG: hypothetical protein BWY21_00338 [Parcubacteria group bacterium ADurb.Bin216]